MSNKGQMLRALVNARLSAAADEIFALFERTIAEFEEEMCRSKAENQRKQELLDSAQNPTVLMVFQTPTVSPDPGLMIQDLQQSISETGHIKEEPEEHRINPEDVQSVCVKTEESSPFQLTHTELGEDTHGGDTCAGDMSADTLLQPLPEVDTDYSCDTYNNEDCGAAFICSDTHMETEVNGHHSIPVQTRGTRAAAKGPCNKKKSNSETNAAEEDTSSESDGDTPSESDGDTTESDGDTTESDGDTTESDGETSKSEGDTSKSDRGMYSKIKECPFCNKRFYNKKKSAFEAHVRIHTGEKPFRCPVCSKEFATSALLSRHRVVHNTPQNDCSICKKTFSQKGYLKVHMRIHTGERPYSCSVCERTFVSASSLYTHKRSHTGPKSHICQTCGKGFLYSSNLKQHMMQHTGVKPFSCSICEKRFTHKGTLLSHLKLHDTDYNGSF